MSTLEFKVWKRSSILQENIVSRCHREFAEKLTEIRLDFQDVEMKLQKQFLHHRKGLWNYNTEDEFIMNILTKSSAPTTIPSEYTPFVYESLYVRTSIQFVEDQFHFNEISTITSCLDQHSSTKRLTMQTIDNNRFKLRSELRSTVSKKQEIDNNIKYDILRMRRILQTSSTNQLHNQVSPQTKSQMKIWGVELAFTILSRILQSFQMLSLHRWKQNVNFQKYERRKKEYKRTISAWKLFKIFQYSFEKKMIKVWMSWLYHIYRLKLMDQKELELRSSIAIQSYWRMILSKKIFIQMYMSYLNGAATTLQRHTRGFFSRKKVQTIIWCRLINGYAVMIQCAFRMKQSRSRMYHLIREKNRDKKSIVIQRVLRGMFARNLVSIERQKRNELRSIMILQNLARNRIAYNKFKDRHKYKRKVRAAILIQTHTRINLDKMQLYVLKRERQEQLKRNIYHSKNIQKIVRGHLTRLKMKERVQIAIAESRKRSTAILCLQCWFRYISAKISVHALQKEKQETMISDARLWQELWSEDSQT